MSDDSDKRPEPFMWCPICEITLRSGPGGDDKTLYKWGCCLHCFIEFVEHREERWEGGWRPSEEDVERMFEKMRR